AMIALAIGQPEQPLLEDRVFAIPERQRKTQHLMVVTDPRQAILTPAIRAGSCLVMREVIPGVTVVAVILPHRPPLPLAQVWAPFTPGHVSFARLLQALVLFGARHILASFHHPMIEVNHAPRYPAVGHLALHRDHNTAARQPGKAPATPLPQHKG